MTKEPGYVQCDLNNFSKLKIVDGKIYYRLYKQDGGMQEMEVEDNRSNRLLVSWIQIHDRY